jgi:hypothetical protein
VPAISREQPSPIEDARGAGPAQATPKRHPRAGWCRRKLRQKKQELLVDDATLLWSCRSVLSQTIELLGDASESFRPD